MLSSAFKLPQCALEVILPLHIDLLMKAVFVCSIIQYCASCEKSVVGSFTKEIFRNLYMCTKLLYCYFSSVLRYVCFSSFRKWVCEFSSFTKSARNYWWWEWLGQSHAYKVSTSTWRW